RTGRPRKRFSASARPAVSMSGDYFRFALTLANVPFRLEPSEFTATMIATEMPAAIRPYSIAVAPRSSRMKDLRSFITISTLPNFCARQYLGAVALTRLLYRVPLKEKLGWTL